MERIFRFFLELLDENGFISFQNELAQSMYNALGEGYLKKENEVSLVTRLVDAINGMRYKHFKIFSHKIHGARSYVEFNYQDKPTTKELADMVVISLVTNKRERILQRVSFIQNKVSHSNSWSIDEEQLFLLKNFPPFSGDRGIFAGHKEVLFKNHSKCLGSFGLFNSPGEMIFISAPLISEFKRGKMSISTKDISYSGPSTNIHGTHNQLSMPDMKFFDPFFLEEFFHYMRKYLGKYPFPFPLFGASSNFPCFRNEIFTRDLYDFSKNWTQINIGEYSYAFGKKISPALDSFTNFLLRSTGIEEYVDLPIDEHLSNLKPNNEIGVFAMHTDISEEE